jgi:hypothetical protein
VINVPKLLVKGITSGRHDFGSGHHSFWHLARFPTTFEMNFIAKLLKRNLCKQQLPSKT